MHNSVMSASEVDDEKQTQMQPLQMNPQMLPSKSDISRSNIMGIGSPSSDNHKRGRSHSDIHSNGELMEERTIMVYHPHAISFEEHKTHDGTVITVLEIIEPTNLELVTKFRSSVDLSRLISKGDMVCKVNEQYIDPNTPFDQFQSILDAEFKKAKNQPVSITVLKTSYKKHGKLKNASTVRNALKWKAEQEGINTLFL